MNNVVTFFTKARTGYESEFKKKLDNIDYTIAIHTDKAFNHKELQPYPVTYETNINGYIDKIKHHLTQQTGGIIVTHYENNGKLHVEITTIQRNSSNNIDNYPVPEEVFCFEPGDIKLQPLPLVANGTTKPKPLNRGAHIIVPVDKEAQEKFKTFITECNDWFPADFQINLAYLLRNPSLAFRVNCLENLVLAPSRENDNKDKPRYVAPFDPAIDQVLLLLVLIALLLAPLYSLYSLHFTSNTPATSANLVVPANPVAPVNAVAPANPVAPATPASPAMELLPEIKKSLTTLIVLKNNNKLPEKFFDKYFSPLYENVEGQLQVKNNLQLSVLLEDKNFLWGVINLRPITDNLLQNNTFKEVIEGIITPKNLDIDTQSKTSEAYKKIYGTTFKGKCWLDSVISGLDNAEKVKKKFGEAFFPTHCNDQDKDKLLLEGFKTLTDNLNKLSR